MWEWDEDKRQSNLAKHGVDFADVLRFDWTYADIWPDNRFDYGEARMLALGLLDGRIYYVVYTERGPVRRLISLRKANERERKRWNMSAK